MKIISIFALIFMIAGCTVEEDQYKTHIFEVDSEGAAIVFRNTGGAKSIMIHNTEKRLTIRTTKYKGVLDWSDVDYFRYFEGNLSISTNAHITNLGVFSKPNWEVLTSTYGEQFEFIKD